MLIQLIISSMIGILAGIFTGLIPGIHINLIGVILISLSASLFSSFNPIYLVVFITSMAITHTFLDFIPSVFLGCPDTDTELSILPGHELLKKGHAYQAIILTAYGGLAALLILILIAFPAALFIDNIQNLLTKNYLLPMILILISLSLILLEKRKFSALLVFLLTGFLGLCTLNLNISQPILPLLTGLFGASNLILSIKNKIQIPEQKIENPNTNLKKPLAGAFLGSLIASPLCSFFPGLGSSQAAIIGSQVSKTARTNKKSFLILLGATNTLVMGFSFLSLYAISKTRTGAALAIQQILGEISWKILALILLAVLFSGIISFFLTKFLAKLFSKNITKINYTFISIATLIILALVVSLVSGIQGLAVLIISTLTGIYCILLKVKRTNMMGCLLIPTIIFYLI